MNPTITLPFPTAKLSGHNNGGWRRKAGPIAASRALAAEEAMAIKRLLKLPPHPEDIGIAMHFYPPNRRSDRVNFANRMKPYLDGIADALGFNDIRLLPTYHFHQPDKDYPRVEIMLGAAPTMSGWRPHNGGPCPVDEDSFPQVLTRRGEHDCERASDQQWEWTGEYPDDEIVAYWPEAS